MHILITRQIEQSKKFSYLLKEKNIENSIFPVIRIKNIQIKKEDEENFEKSNFVIFTSQNSVTSLMKNWEDINFNGKKIAAIGESTKTILNTFNINVDIVPKFNFTSESLLEEIVENNINNKKIVIIKGLEGRNYLHKHLSRNNTVLNDINVYGRYLPENIDKLTLDNMPNFTHVCITSIEILNNFIKIKNILEFTISRHIIFISGNERISKKIKEEFPHNNVLISINPTNKEMLKTILEL